MSARPTSRGVPGRAGFWAAMMLAALVLAAGCGRSPAARRAPGGHAVTAAGDASPYVCALCGRDLSQDTRRMAAPGDDGNLLYFCSPDHRDQYREGLRAPRDVPYCTVCLRTVQRNDPAVRELEHGSAKYLVCSEVCAAQFTQQPELFIRADTQ